jgi:hypothetical protein
MASPDILDSGFAFSGCKGITVTGSAATVDGRGSWFDDSW